MTVECFHCQLPVASGSAFPILYRQTEQWTCCAGCQAVAQSIIASNLDDYYAKRTQAAETSQGTDETFWAQLYLYDEPEVQKKFVYATDETACASLLVEGVTCAACVWLIEQSLSQITGVVSAHVNYSSHRLQVTWRPETILLSDILKHLQHIGYHVQPYDDHQASQKTARQRKLAWSRLWIAALSMMQVMMYAWPTYWYGHTGRLEAQWWWLLHWTSLILTLPVVTYCAWPFYQGLVQDMKRRRVGMDTPVSLAIGLAFGGSLYAFAQGHVSDVYFDSIAMFVFLLLGARYLEQLAHGKLDAATRELGQLLPIFCHGVPNYPHNTQVQECLLAHVKIDDVVLVKVGEVVPVDGVVVCGRSEINQALLSGESLPVPKQVGDEVQAGSLNMGGLLHVKTTHVGPYTRLAAMVRLLDAAHIQKPRFVQMADRFAAWFLAGLLVLSVLVFGVWWQMASLQQALLVTVSLLVITCPCALSLATPTALAASIGFLAQHGLFVKNAQSVEVLAQVTDVVFDKTGTLTEGRFEWVQTTILPPWRPNYLQACAAALEQYSEHVLAKAIVIQSQHLVLPEVENIEVVVGFGVCGRIHGQKWAVGRPEWVSGLFEVTQDIMAHANGENTTSVWLANEQGIVAQLGFVDKLKPDMNMLVQRLLAQNVKVHLLSGDHEGVVAHVAKHLNITTWQSAATPESKVQYVQNLQQSKCTVLMVGDGLNDAPVLLQSNVSIAVLNYSDLANAHSDAIVHQDNVGMVAMVLRHSLQTQKIIRQNLIWALLYNILAIPMAILGWVTPAWAALGMGLSSLLVMGNALRLLRYGDEQ